MLPELRRVNHSESEEKQNHGKYDAETEADSPNTNGRPLVVGRKYNKGDNASGNESGINREVSRQSNQYTASALYIGALIASFGRTGSADWVFAARSWELLEEWPNRLRC